MSQVEKTVLVNHSAEHMYKLVDAVEDYPKFLPWCGGVDLLQRDDATTVARLHIDYHGIRQNFTTENRKTYPSIMEGIWRFIALSDDACKIEFRLSYEFSNIFLEKLIAPVFSHIANTFVDAFVTRADQVYR